MAGRADVLRVLDYRRMASRNSPPVAHQGTYNAAPVSAAAGIATLKEVRDSDAIDRANRTAAAIRDGINAIRRRGLRWCAYGQFSDFHLYRGDDTPEEIYAGRVPWQALKGGYSGRTAEQDPRRLSAARRGSRRLAGRTCLGGSYR